VLLSYRMPERREGGRTVAVGGPVLVVGGRWSPHASVAVTMQDAPLTSSSWAGGHCISGRGSGGTITIVTVQDVLLMSSTLDVD